MKNDGNGHWTIDKDKFGFITFKLLQLRLETILRCWLPDNASLVLVWID